MNKFNRMMAGVASTAALAGGLNEIQNYESIAQAQPTAEQVYESQFAAYCIETAVGVSNGGLDKIDPAEQVGSRYLSNNLKKLAITVVANEVPSDCRRIVTGRQITAEQIYKGKVNTRKPEVFKGLDEINETRQVALKSAFSCIKGRKVRGYQEKASIVVTTNGHGTFSKTTYDTIRGKNDGC